MHRMAPPIVLSIAGFDPTSGAGITADVKTIAAHHCYGAGCVTALTVQSTTGVLEVQPVAGDLLRHSLDALAGDLPIAAVRVGMLGSAEVADALADFLQASPLPNVVLDPILKSSSGTSLIDEPGIQLLRSRLLPLVALITPNIDEAAILSDLPVTNVPQMRTAAARLHELGATNLVITGGHLEQPIDLLSVSGNSAIEQEELRSDKIHSRSTHGTGCAFATAVACNLAHGRSMREAVLLAKAYVTQAIARAYPLGKGTGPVHHLYRMDELESSVKTGGQFEHPREARFKEGA